MSSARDRQWRVRPYPTPDPLLKPRDGAQQPCNSQACSIKWYY